MNEITRIHLAGTPYSIELPAKKALEKYLQDVQKALKADADALREIEARMVELLAERGVKLDGVITDGDVAALRHQLGEPSDFSDTETAADQPAVTPLKRRFMRDTSNAMLGGIASGIAAYLGWDVTLTRVALIVLTFLTSGIIIPIYLVMWIVVPGAQSAADRLQMAGEPVTAAALAEASSQSDASLRTEAALVKILRIFFGIGFVVAAFSALAAVMLALGVSFTQRNGFLIAENSSWFPLSLALMALGGVLAGVLCGLIAGALFTKKTGRIWLITVIVTAVVGFMFFASGAAMTVYNGEKFAEEIQRSEYSRKVEVPADWNGVNSLDIQTDKIDVKYIATADTPTAELRYNTRFVESPNASLVRDQNKIIIRGKAVKTPKCNAGSIGCTPVATLIISGSPIENAKVKYNYFDYETTRQNTLKLSVESANISITATDSIGELDAYVHKNSTLTTGETTIDNLRLNTSDSNFYLNNAQKVDVTTLGTCSAGTRSHIVAPKVNHFSHNGKAISGDYSDACLTITASNNSPDDYRVVRPDRYDDTYINDSFRFKYN